MWILLKSTASTPCHRSKRNYVCDCQPSNSVRLYHQQGIAQFIHLKALEIVAVDRNRDDVKDRRLQLAEWQMVKHGAGNDIVYTDESGFNLWLAKTRGHAKARNRAVRVVSACKETNFTQCRGNTGLIQPWYGAHRVPPRWHQHRSIQQFHARRRATTWKSISDVCNRQRSMPSQNSPLGFCLPPLYVSTSIQPIPQHHGECVVCLEGFLQAATGKIAASTAATSLLETADHLDVACWAKSAYHQLPSPQKTTTYIIRCVQWQDIF